METVSEEIKLLIVAYLTGELNEKDSEIFMQWLYASNENREHFNRIKASWELAGKNKLSNVPNIEKSWDEALGKLENKKIIKGMATKQWLKIAATWLLLIAVGSVATILISNRKHQQVISGKTEITAPLGAKSIVTMPDGTKVWLNAGSKLTYNTAFNENDRIVELTGEAFFHVKTDAAKPFVVKTTDIMVRALGTRFNVKAYPDEKTITTTLEEGKIDVRLISSANNETIVLKPKENIIFYKPNTNKEIAELKVDNSPKPEINSPEQLSVQENVKTELYTSWKEEKWIIESEPLSTLIPKLERKFNLTIAFSDKEIMNYKFSGSIKNETLEQILRALSFTAPITYIVEKDKITLHMNEQIKDKFSRIITPKN